MTSAARDLMDTGTPGPWTTYALPEKPDHWTMTGIGVPDDEMGHRAEAMFLDDARKIVLSVNALPLVDALCEVIDQADQYGEALRGVWLDNLLAARASLESALGGGA